MRPLLALLLAPWLGHAATIATVAGTGNGGPAKQATIAGPKAVATGRPSTSPTAGPAR